MIDFTFLFNYLKNLLQAIFAISLAIKSQCGETITSKIERD